MDQVQRRFQDMPVCVKGQWGRAGREGGEGKEGRWMTDGIRSMYGAGWCSAVKYSLVLCSAVQYLILDQRAVRSRRKETG